MHTWARTHRLYLAWPVNLLKTYNPLISSSVWMRSRRSYYMHACIQYGPSLAVHWNPREHTHNLSADNVLLVSAQTLQSRPPLNTKVAKNKSNILDMTWFRCNTDTGTRARLTDPTVKVTHLISVTSLWPAEKAAVAIRLSVTCRATSEREVSYWRRN